VSHYLLLRCMYLLRSNPKLLLVCLSSSPAPPPSFLRLRAHHPPPPVSGLLSSLSVRCLNMVRLSLPRRFPNSVPPNPAWKPPPPPDHVPFPPLPYAATQVYSFSSSSPLNPVLSKANEIAVVRTEEEGGSIATVNRTRTAVLAKRRIVSRKEAHLSPSTDRRSFVFLLSRSKLEADIFVTVI